MIILSWILQLLWRRVWGEWKVAVNCNRRFMRPIPVLDMQLCTPLLCTQLDMQLCTPPLSSDYKSTRSLGSLWAPTSNWTPFGPLDSSNSPVF